MKRLLFLLLLSAFSLAANESVSVSLRGKPYPLARISPATNTRDAAVIFLPGDGGWRGVAVGMATTIASWGYEVYGFDTREYLEAFSDKKIALSRDQMSEDMRQLADAVSSVSRKPIVFVGWSQGAGMAVTANAGQRPSGSIRGIVTVSLPESAVLGWDWKATLATLARRAPDQPAFAIKPLLVGISMPIWMIHGSEDEYTSAEMGRALFQAASEPKRFHEIRGANHRFEGHRAELYRSIKEGLDWIGAG